MDFFHGLMVYWSSAAIQTNLLVFMNLAGALFLGSVVGYERAYHGRAAGMRTYGLVCMAAAGLTAVAGEPGQWFGGLHAAIGPADPTRVIQGIVTGIGFLGAGVILKEGLNISGLTTAASIWTASCIGVLVGVGFYAAALLLTGLSACIMMWGSRIEEWLPSHPAVCLTLRCRGSLEIIIPRARATLAALGYKVAEGSFSVSIATGVATCRFIVVVEDRRHAATLPAIASAFGSMAEIESLELMHARN